MTLSLQPDDGVWMQYGFSEVSAGCSRINLRCLHPLIRLIGGRESGPNSSKHFFVLMIGLLGSSLQFFHYF